MKRLYNITIVISSFLILLVFCFSCQEKNKRKIDKDEVVVTGNVKNFKDTTLTFSYYSYDFLKNLQKEKVKFHNGNFKLKMKASAPLKGWLSFGDIPVQKEIHYTQINGKDTIMKTGTFDPRMIYIYLEPGDSLNMNLDVNDIAGTYNFSGRNVDNNEFVNREEKRFNDYKHKFLNNWYNVANREPNDYKTVIDNNYREKMEFLKKSSDSMKLTKPLIDFYKNKYYADAVGSKINYPNVHSMYNENEETQLPSDYYNFMDNVSLKAKIGPNGIGYFYNLRSYLNKKYELAQKRENEKREYYDWTKTELPEEVRYEYMAYSLGSDFSRRLYNEFGSDSPYPSMAKVVKEKYKELEGMLEGNPAPKVSFQDTQGKTISIKDMQGKYTYIDLWATWCGPCIKEMPSLKKLQKKYKNKNIQFVSVSIDDKKDHDKWQKFVKDHDLRGMQLIANDKAHKKMAKAFNIKMIPRFIFLDPEGKIIDATAPFPSDPQLEKLFQEKNI